MEGKCDGGGGVMGEGCERRREGEPGEEYRPGRCLLRACPSPLSGLPPAQQL